MVLKISFSCSFVANKKTDKSKQQSFCSSFGTTKIYKTIIRCVIFEPACHLHPKNVVCVPRTVSACLYFESVKRPGPIFYILIPFSYTRVCNKETDNSNREKQRETFYFEKLLCNRIVCVFVRGCL